MANDIDLWNDIEDAERTFGKQSDEYKKAVAEFMKEYPETIWGNSPYFQQKGYGLDGKKNKNTWYRSKRATKVFTDKEEGYNVVEYQGCPVVQWNDDEIILNKCGWQSHTTKDRMNQASREYGLGYRVYQKDFSWFVEWQNETYEFDEDTITIPRKKKSVSGLNFPDQWGVRNDWRPKYLNEL
jgi:hypothetical protein